MKVRGFWATVAVAAATLSLAGMTACGSGGDQTQTAANPNEKVADVNGTPITRAQVDHWMKTLAGRDFYTVSHRLATPQGLVSDPPNYARCVAKLESVAASSKEKGGELLVKCRQLYQALRIQATSYLVGALRGIGIARELGVTVSDATAEHRYKQISAREYPSEAAYRQYLTSTGENVSDAVLETKLELLGTTLIDRLKDPAGKVRYGLAEQRWATKISCSPGYVVEYCKQYKGGATYPTTPPPSVLMERIAALVTGHCINLAACRDELHK